MKQLIHTLELLGITFMALFIGYFIFLMKYIV